LTLQDLAVEGVINKEEDLKKKIKDKENT